MDIEHWIEVKSDEGFLKLVVETVFTVLVEYFEKIQWF
jgi:hypothetical protein